MERIDCNKFKKLTNEELAKVNGGFRVLLKTETKYKIVDCPQDMEDRENKICFEAYTVQTWTDLNNRDMIIGLKTYTTED